MRKILVALIFILITAMSGCADKSAEIIPERTSLSVLIYDRGDVPEGAGTITDNAVTRWIQENFGEPNNIDVSFVSVPRTNAREIMVLLASGDAPDIVYAYELPTMHRYYLNGDVIELDDYLDSFPKLVEFIGEERIEQCMLDGKKVVIPARRLISGRQAQLVRKDWLDKLGLDVPQNTDEFYDMLCKFRDYDPGNNGDKNIPYGISGNSANYSDLINSFLDVDFSDEVFMNCGNIVSEPGFKDGLRFMNKMYNEGLLSPNFEYDKERKKVESDIAAGYVGFFCDDLGRPLQVGGVYEQLKNNIPGAELAAVDTWTSKNGSKNKCVYDDIGLFIGINSTCRTPENALKYLEWISEPDVLNVLQYGFEGVTYEYDKNNYPVVIESTQSRINHWYNLGFDLSLTVNGKFSENEDEIIGYNAAATVDPQLYKACYENSVRDGWTKRHVSLLYDIPEAVNDSVRRDELSITFMVDCIICSPEEFDSLFDNTLAQYTSLGIDKIVEGNYEDYYSRYGN